MRKNSLQSGSPNQRVESSEESLSPEAVEELLKTWPRPRAAPLADPFLPKIELRLRGEWKQAASHIFEYQFKVSARRFFFGDSKPVPLETLTLHWMFQPRHGAARVGHRTMTNAVQIEKTSTFDQELFRALAWAEGWNKNKQYRSFLAVLA
ncbi:hypothetical protein [Pelagibius sp.]|uniref:hypothetical protein n=1 Tax=Pelagibius sp. TaxID=1931238 RepID=UPI00261603B1|nr:hypothetical protein [Pelagibius sp.]